MSAGAYAASEPLSPELVLVLPEELAAEARARLPEPRASAPSAPPPRRRLRARELAALYGACLAFALTPFALLVAFRTVPRAHPSRAGMHEHPALVTRP